MIENILMALASLRANKMRALLTMLGIIIGISSVIAIVTLGNSLSGSISESMQGVGANNITLSLQSKKEDRYSDYFTGMSGMGGNIAEKHLLTNEMLMDLRQTYPDNIEAISLRDDVGGGKTTSGRKYANLSLIGVTEEYVKANKMSFIKGRFLNQKDENGVKKVAVVSDKLAQNIFGNAEAIGQQITINAANHTGVYTIIGIYKNQINAMGFNFASDKDMSTDVYIPLSLAKKITKTQGYQSVELLTSVTTDVMQFQEEVKHFFNKYYKHNKDYGITVFSMQSMLDSIKDVMGKVKLFVAAIAAISLLVGGIGVMNIMLVSITERTREIGTRKAVGATNNEIRMQFIVEAMIICLIGGMIGIALGVGLGSLGAKLLSAPAKTSLGTVLFTTAFSMMIGVFFGYYPANKAAKLNPIDALRYE